MANRTPLALGLLTVAALLLVAPSAGAQCQCPDTPATSPAPVYSAAPSGGVVYYSAMPQSSLAAEPQRRRIGRRVVDLLIDPVAVLRGRPVPSNAPLLDAAPNGLNAGLAVAYIAGASISAGITVGVPVGLRAGRVLLAGPPAAAHDRRETLLWIAEPTLLSIKQRREARQAAGQPVFLGER